jgi:hypothetical protein
MDLPRVTPDLPMGAAAIRVSIVEGARDRRSPATASRSLNILLRKAVNQILCLGCYFPLRYAS